MFILKRKLLFIALVFVFLSAPKAGAVTIIGAALSASTGLVVTPSQ